LHLDSGRNYDRKAELQRPGEIVVRRRWRKSSPAVCSLSGLLIVFNAELVVPSVS
jgi:hypothetical protein